MDLLVSFQVLDILYLSNDSHILVNWYGTKTATLHGNYIEFEPKLIYKLLPNYSTSFIPEETIYYIKNMWSIRGIIFNTIFQLEFKTNRKYQYIEIIFSLYMY